MEKHRYNMAIKKAAAVREAMVKVEQANCAKLIAELEAAEKKVANLEALEANIANTLRTIQMDGLAALKKKDYPSLLKIFESAGDTAMILSNPERAIKEMGQRKS